MKIGDKIIVTDSPYDPTLVNGSIMTITEVLGNGYVCATVDGGNSFEWCMTPRTFKPYTPDVGTLSEIGALPGDVVQVIGGKSWEIVGIDDKGNYLINDPPARHLSNTLPFRIISRAPETPTLWRDMTPEEKGALLLAKHEGKDIEEYYGDAVGWISYQGSLCSDAAYRVCKEPVRETVTVCDNGSGVGSGVSATKGYKITFDTVDGIPQCDTIKMEEL